MTELHEENSWETQIRQAIFDVDGTLLDSMPIWRDVGTRYLSQFGIRAEDGLYETLFPMTLEESSRYLKERYMLLKDPDEIRQGFVGIIEQFYREEVQLKPGAAELLKRFYEKGIGLTVLSTGEEALLDAALTRLNVRRYFGKILTCTGLGMTKRTPEIFLKAAEILQVRPQEAVVFEDVLYAIESAEAGGFRTVAVSDTANSGSFDRIRKTADLFIENFYDGRLFGLL